MELKEERDQAEYDACEQEGKLNAEGRSQPLIRSLSGSKVKRINLLKVNKRISTHLRAIRKS